MVGFCFNCEEVVNLFLKDVEVVVQEILFFILVLELNKFLIFGSREWLKKFCKLKKVEILMLCLFSYVMSIIVVI